MKGTLPGGWEVLCKLDSPEDPSLNPHTPSSPQTFKIFSSCFCASTTMMLARQSQAMYWQASGELVV